MSLGAHAGAASSHQANIAGGLRDVRLTPKATKLPRSSEMTQRAIFDYKYGSEQMREKDQDSRGDEGPGDAEADMIESTVDVGPLVVRGAENVGSTDPGTAADAPRPAISARDPG